MGEEFGALNKPRVMPPPKKNIKGRPSSARGTQTATATKSQIPQIPPFKNPQNAGPERHRLRFIGSSLDAQIASIFRSNPLAVSNRGDANLRHPNLCVANLLGEVHPIFQKIRDFSPLLGGRLKQLRLHESWRECRDALKMEYRWSRSLSLALLRACCMF